MTGESPLTAAEVWSVLVAECGADPMLPGTYADFLHHWPCDEYRFQGALGFGGKVRNPSIVSSVHRAPYVDCYPEDMTEEREAMLGRANQRLDTMVMEKAGYVWSEPEQRYVKDGGEHDGTD